jgi:hypothetical protein
VSVKTKGEDKTRSERELEELGDPRDTDERETETGKSDKTWEPFDVGILKRR